MSCSGLLYSPQLFSIWSRLVQTPPKQLHTPLSSGTSPNQRWAHRVRMSSQDPVWVAHCQLWYLSGGWLGAIRTWSLSFTPKKISSRPLHQPCQRHPVSVLPDGYLLLLRPHDARLEMGLEPRGRTDDVWTRPLFLNTVAMIGHLLWGYLVLHISTVSCCNKLQYCFVFNICNFGKCHFLTIYCS